MIETVPSPASTRCVIGAPFTHLCPVKDEVDEGVLTVAWTTFDATIELHSLAAYLRTWADRKVTHEELCQLIAREVAQYGVVDVAVTYEGKTAGLTVHAAYP